MPSKPRWLRKLEWGIEFTQGSTFRGAVRLLCAVVATVALFMGKTDVAIGIVTGATAINGMLGIGVKS